MAAARKSRGMNKIRAEAEARLYQSRQDNEYFRNETNMRYGPDGDMFVAHTPLRRVKHKGKMLIAEYYNTKYNIEIYTPESWHKAVDLINLISSKPDSKMYGFVVPSFASDSHPVPVVLYNGTVHRLIFMSDSIGLVGKFHDFIRALDTESTLIYLDVDVDDATGEPTLSAIGRQADNGSCVIDALLYLRTALQLDISVFLANINAAKSVSLDRRGSYGIFRTPGEIMKIVQFTPYFKAKGIDPETVRLLGGKTVAAARKEYRLKHKYSNGETEVELEDNSYLFLKARILEHMIHKLNSFYSEEEKAIIYDAVSGEKLLREGK